MLKNAIIHIIYYNWEPVVNSYFDFLEKYSFAINVAVFALIYSVGGGIIPSNIITR
jgi:hypothetical protein